MEVLVAAVIILVIIVICKLVESKLRKPLIDRITDRYVFITGCDTGFGHQLARQLDEKGVHVIAACLTEKGRETLDKATSERTITLLMDVTDHESIIKAYERVKEILPDESALWGVVNNAGISLLQGYLEFTRREDYEKIAAVNLFGTIDVTLTFLPLLKNGGGRLVQVTSAAGRLVAGGLSGGYAESKHGLEAFSDIVRLECIRLGYPVKVSILEPGFFRTPISDSDIVTKGIMVSWERLGDEKKKQFPKQLAVDSAKKTTDAGEKFGTTDIRIVTDAMEHALLARWPRTRYTLGWDAKMLWIPFSYLPTSISDPILARI